MLNHVAMEKVSSLLVSLVATIRSTAKLNSFLTILKKKKKSGLKRANPNSVRILLRRVRARFHLDSGVKLNVITKLKALQPWHAFVTGVSQEHEITHTQHLA